MKRIHLFEFEDFDWFPNWLRDCMTRYIIAIHNMLGSSQHIANLFDKILEHSSEKHFYDLCSGSGGPLIKTLDILRKKQGNQDVKLTFSDLYPNQKVAAKINSGEDAQINYLTEPVNAARMEAGMKGVRTMICSMHHMKPDTAKSILANAKSSHQPICVYEISDNSMPKWIWCLAFPINIITVLLFTPLVRPLTLQQILFTYIIPILPIVIAWDGAVSNARTYTLEDMDILLEGLESENYLWEKGIIKGKAKHLYLLGLPKL